MYVNYLVLIRWPANEGLGVQSGLSFTTEHKIEVTILTVVRLSYCLQCYYKHRDINPPA